MNQFYLINENNTRFNLKDFSQKAFIPSIKGLGYKHNTSFIKVGNTYQNDYQDIDQGTLSGTAMFSSYSNYLDFVSFVENANSLRLIYVPIDEEYFRNVTLQEITNVVNKGNIVEADLSLYCNGLWYKSTDTRFIIEDVAGQSQYDLLFDYTFNDYASIDVVFNNVGHVEAEMIVEFYGFIEKPKIELYQNNELKYTVEFNKTIQINEKLIYSARDGQNYVVFQDASGVQTNAVSTLSLTNDNFFRIPRGYSKIVVSSEGGTVAQVVFRILTSYKGV